jgi:aminoglycoside phosphotransferase (APT) family kinase protein
VGPLESEAKWRSAHLALDLARSVGLPVADLVGISRRDGSLVRMFSWLEGRPATEVVVDEASRERLVRSLSSAMRTLHSIDTRRFSSRLDGSAPAFARWSDYVSYRLDRISHRCRSVDAMDEPTLRRCVDAVERLSLEADGAARPTLCHRDLHPDNLLVDDTGVLVGLIDWDQAESWDPAGEWYKLEWMLAEQLGVSTASITAAYFDGHDPPAIWPERLRLVQAMEALNAVPNAVMGGDVEFEKRCRRHLAELLARVSGS